MAEHMQRKVQKAWGKPVNLLPVSGVLCSPASLWVLGSSHCLSLPSLTFVSYHGFLFCVSGKYLSISLLHMVL